MRLRHLHDWNLTPTQAIALQKDLRSQIIHAPLDIEQVKLVAGVDVSVKNGMSQAAVVVCALPDFSVIETVCARLPTPFPYVPGLLTFREGPVLIEAFSRLCHEPDVFLFDGMGIAHPRRMGVAAHMGLLLDRPSIGCGKSRLCGYHDEPGSAKGASAPLRDKIRGEVKREAGDEEVIGMVLRTRANVSPVFISPGHRADIATSVSLTMRCISRYRLPEPIRLAHRAAGEFGKH